MTSANRYLFVYGTLRPGANNRTSDLLSRSTDWVGSGRARGQLFLVADYPGFVPSESGDDWVHGDVYLLHNPEMTYPELDRYEGCGINDKPPHEYQRSIIPVVLDSGRWIEASTYVYAWETGDKPRIESGDFLRITPAASVNRRPL
jgi:gamma-glutamylcyclotransferase (GGCT)/AIG2-like uncharacterized protein YtfP